MEAISQGRHIPIESLSADNFESFVHQVFIQLSTDLGFKITTGPLNSGDQGFDLSANRTSDNSVVCIQCKRYNSKAIGIPILTAELIKVAKTSKKEGSIVKEYYLLTTGSLTQELASEIRKSNRDSILERCKTETQNNDEYDVVREFINNLEKIVIWSPRDFDNNIGSKWSKFTDIIENFFRIDNILREYPRPDFDPIAYVSKTTLGERKSIRLNCTLTETPNNVYIERSDYRLQKPKLKNNNIKHCLVQDLPSHTAEESSILLIGAGGSGKSNSLQKIHADLCDKYKTSGNGEIPVYIQLSDYRGDLNKLINENLSINYGTWISIPNNFFLLLDGIDEIPETQIRNFFNQLSSIESQKKSKSVLTCRESGLSKKASIVNLQCCYKINRLNYKSISHYISESVSSRPNDLIDGIYNLSKTTGTEIISYPLGVSLITEYFIDNGDTPTDFRETISNSVRLKIERNKEFRLNDNREITNLSTKTVTDLSKLISFNIRVIHQKTSLTEEELEDVIKTSTSHAREIGIFGADDISEQKMFNISTQFEIVKKSENGNYRIDHDIISDYLASHLLAKNWRVLLQESNNLSPRDAWIFSSDLIPENERYSFITELCDRDLVLASQCSEILDNAGEDYITRKIVEFNKSDTIGIFCKAMLAASIIKNDESIKIIKENLYSSNAFRRNNASRYLAMSGDEEHLKSIIYEHDSALRSGLELKGGSYSHWFSAPISSILKISREHLEAYKKDPEVKILIPLETLNRYGGHSDINYAKHIFNQTKNIREFQESTKFLIDINQDLAKSLLIEKSKKINTDPFALDAMCISCDEGIEIDGSKIFEWFVDNKDIKSRTNHNIIQRVEKILCNAILPEDYENRLIEFTISIKTKLDNISNVNSFYTSWKIATSRKLKSFEEIAIKNIKEGGIIESTASILYGAKQFNTSNKKDTFKEALVEKLEEISPENTNNINIYLLCIESLIDINQLETSSQYIERFIDAFQKIYFKSINERNHTDLIIRFPRILESIQRTIEFYPYNFLKRVIGCDLTTSSNEQKVAYEEIIKRIPFRNFIHLIEEIRDPFIRIYNISLLRYFKKDRESVDIFLRNIHEMLSHHINYPALTSLLEEYWSYEVESAFINAITDFPWKKDSPVISMMRDQLIDISQLMDKGSISRSINPAIDRSTSPETIHLLSMLINFINSNEE